MLYTHNLFQKLYVLATHTVTPCELLFIRVLALWKQVIHMPHQQNLLNITQQILRVGQEINRQFFFLSLGSSSDLMQISLYMSPLLVCSIGLSSPYQHSHQKYLVFSFEPVYYSHAVHRGATENSEDTSLLCDVLNVTGYIGPAQCAPPPPLIFD